jgi:isochorismate pyruvate lyase
MQNQSQPWPASPAAVPIADRPAPEACQTMIEVRVGVDALDQALVLLLAERQRYMEAAARIKSDRNRVHDSARIEDVVAKVKAGAVRAGLSTAIAEPVWRTLINQSIAHELNVWDLRRTTGGE